MLPKLRHFCKWWKTQKKIRRTLEKALIEAGSILKRSIEKPLDIQFKNPVSLVTQIDKKAERLIKLNKLDYGIDAGIGFHFYFPVFVLTPELKLGWGMKNVHSRDPNLKFSNVIDKINSRTLTLSLTVE